MSFLDDLVHGAGNIASRAYDQVNPFDNGLSATTRVARTNNNVLNQITQSKPATFFGGIGQQAQAGIAAVPASVYHTAALVPDIARGFGAAFTGNSPALQSSLNRYRNDYSQSIPQGFTQPALQSYHMLQNTGILGTTPEQVANYKAQNIQANLLRQGATPAQAEQAANMSRLQDYNNIFKSTGINRDDSAFTTYRKAASSLGQNALNVATLGSAAEKTALAAGKSPSLLENLAQRATKANKTALINTAGSVTGALGQDKVTLGNVAQAATQGYTGGLAFDAAGQLYHGAKPAIQDKITPKYNGLAKDQVIMNLDHLNQLKATSEMLKHRFSGNLEDQYTPTTAQVQQSVNAMHEIKNQYGHDFISGSPHEISTRIDKFMEQNGEAVPQLQQKLMADQSKQSYKEAANKVDQDGGYMGGKSRQERIQEELAKQNVPKELQKQWYRGVDEFNRSAKDHYYSADKDVAGDYGKVQRVKPENVPKNPLMAMNKDVLAHELGFKGNAYTNEFDTFAKKYAQSKGHDSIHYEDGSLGAPEIHKFAPEPQAPKPTTVLGKAADNAKKFLSDEQGSVGLNIKGDGENVFKPKAELPKGYASAGENAQYGRYTKGDKLRLDDGRTVDVVGNKSFTISGSTYTKVRTPDGKIETINHRGIQEAYKPTSTVVPPKEPAVPASTKAQDNRSVSSTGSIAPKEKLSRFANKTVQNSDEVSTPLKKLVKEEKVAYDPTTDAVRVASAEKMIKTKGKENAFNHIINEFDTNKSEKGQHIANAIALAKKLDASTKEADLYKATELYGMVSKRLTERGQEIQAGSLLNNRTPQGLMYSAQKALRKAGVELTPEVQKTIKNFTDEVKKTEVGTDARDTAVKKLQQYVGKQIPTSATDKAIGIWKAGLLTGAKTITGNALSNGTFGVLHDISKPLSVGLDKAASLITGNRTSSLTYGKRIAGGAEGFQKAWGKNGFMWTGIDERQGVSNKFLENGGKQVNYKNKIVDGYVNGVFRNMAAQDRPFYYSQLRNSMYDLAKTDGINKGLSGKELKTHAEAVFNKPPIELMQVAKNEADQAVLANKTALSAIASGARKGIDGMEKGVGKTVLKVGLETTAPFTGVPSAFVSRVIDFSPVGALKEIGDQIYHKKFDQRALTTALSEATTGTAIMWLGSTLAKNNMLSGAYPTDPKEQARWKAEGITPNSIKVDGKWISANYLGPTGMLLNAGARAHDASSKGGNAIDQITQAAGGVPKDLTQQSFLQGVNNAVSAVNDPGRYLNNYINSQAGSVVPTLVNDIGSASDPYLRDKNSPLDAIKARLPGARNTLPISNDVFGNQLKATSNPIDRMINPLRPSTERTSPILDEVNRLHTKDLNVMPVPVAKKLSFDGEKVNLSNEKRKELQVQLGQGVQNEWNKAIETPEYKALTDEGKKNMLDDIYKKVSEGEKYKFTQSNSLGQFSPTYTGKGNKLSADAKSYVNGGLDLNRFAKEPDAKTALGTPAQKYQSALDQYAIDKKNGDISSVQDIARQNTLAGLKFNSTQNPDIIALHSLPKADVYKYLSTAPKGNDLAKQLLAYDQAATQAGVQTSNKFTDSKGNISIQPKAKRIASGRGRTASRRLSRPSVSSNRKFATVRVKKASFSAKGSSRSLASFKKPSSKTVAVSKKRLRSTLA